MPEPREPFGKIDDGALGAAKAARARRAPVERDAMGLVEKDRQRAGIACGEAVAERIRPTMLDPATHDRRIGRKTERLGCRFQSAGAIPLRLERGR